MKIAITGGTSGIGKAITDVISAEGHEVVNFSRATGFDLRKEGSAFELGKMAKDFDVLINNAYYGMAQVDILYHFYYRWTGLANKTIVCISSLSPEFPYQRPSEYAVHKTALDKACAQLSPLFAGRIINIKPGLVNTPMSAEQIGDRLALSPVKVAETVSWALAQPAEVLISVLNLRAR
jgi:NADP-dependent 3-hydroxy acid dehydrogenase YdfG